MGKTNSLPYKRQGFTLVELAIVLAVIAVLIATFTISMSSVTNQNNALIMESAANKLRTAIYAYAQDQGQFPQSLNDLTSSNGYNYLRNISLNSNGELTVPNVGYISYNNSTVSPCGRESLELQFNNIKICNQVAQDYQNNGVMFGNNCNNNQIILCL